jgi:DNA-binding winged helix-turn-helix (wHTH) protein/tetratricopeptide (TPR) repeat protein
MRKSGFKIGDFSIYPDRGEIHDSTGAQRVEPKVMEVLAFLADRAGEVVSREVLIEEVWRGALITDDVISRCIYQLRKEFGDQGRQLILTVPKRGYRLDAVVTRLDHPEPPRQPQPSPARSRRAHGIPAGVAVALVVLIGVFVVQQWTATPNPKQRNVTPKTLAVRPFAEGTVAGPGVLGPGVAEDLLHRLGRYSGLTVLARSTSFQSDDGVPVSIESDDMVLLEGTISERDGFWILSARLIDAGTGGELWSEDFETAELSINDIQRQIEIGVVQALNAMPGGVVVPGGGYASDNLDAYRMFLAGRERLRSRSPEDLEAARRMFAESIRLDPDYAVAYASLAEVNAQMTIYAGRDWTLLRDTAKQAIRKALDLDPDLAHVHAVDGLVYYVDNDMQLAAPALRKAIQLNPSYATAYMWLGLVYQAQGRLADALAMHKMTATLSPISATAHLNVGMSYQATGDVDNAMLHFKRAIELEPGYGNAMWAMGYADWRRGDLASAVQYFEQAESNKVVNADFYAQFALICFEAGYEEGAGKHTAMAVGMDPSRIWSVRAQLAASTFSNDPDGLVRYLEGLKTSRIPALDSELELAKAFALAGRWQDASDILERRFLGADPRFFDYWDVDWGYLHAMLLVVVRQHLGQDWAVVLNQVKEFLDRTDNSQLSSAGATYLRASVAAIEGRQEDAFELLARAHARGWRRWWWVQVDPSWESLRDAEEYKSLVRELKTSASARASSRPMWAGPCMSTCTSMSRLSARSAALTRRMGSRWISPRKV